MKNSKEFLDKVVLIIEPPYLYNLSLYGITEIDEITYIYNKIWESCDEIIYDNKLMELLRLSIFIFQKELNNEEEISTGGMVDFIESVVIKLNDLGK